MKHGICALILFVSLPSLAGAKSVKFRGYVTSVSSPTIFEIEDFRITRDTSLVIEIDTDERGGNVEFRPEDLRVGTLVEIKGDHNDSTGELKATSIKVLLEDSKNVKRTALMEEPPRLEKTTEVSRKMLEHYSHIRMEAKRRALDAIAQTPNQATIPEGVHQNVHQLPDGRELASANLQN